MTAAAQADTAMQRDPAKTSMVLAPTGRSLPAGTASVGLAAPYIPFAAYSFAEGWQVSAGGVYVFSDFIGGGESYYSYLILKHSLFDDGATSFAVGGMTMFWGQERRKFGPPHWDRATIPGAFAVATFGWDGGALTMGVGLANMAGGFPIGFEGGLLAGVGLGYEARLSDEWKFMTEHFSNLLGNGTLHTFGVRYFTGRVAFDMSLIVVPNADVQVTTGTRIPKVLPLLGVSVLIG